MSQRLQRLRRHIRRSRTRPRVIVGAVGVGVAAMLAIVLIDDNTSRLRIQGDDGMIAVDVPPIRSAAARDPGGDASARVRLPPPRRWFGFSGAFFAWTGSHPNLDQGLTPARTVADAMAAGANSARIDVGWWDLFPQPGKLDREYEAEIDAFINGFERRGGRVLIFLGTTPPYASTRPGDATAAPRTDARTLGLFADYVAFVARRWPHAAAIETWNEPNGRFTWGPRPDPKAYLRLHRTAARAIRAAAPRMPVLLGGIAGTLDHPQFIDAQRYLKRLWSAGLRPRDYDGIAVHPYPEQGSRDPLDQGQFARVFEDFRLGYAWRDPDAKLWITETGSTTTGPTPHSEREQAHVVVALVRKLLSMPRVKGVYLHTQYELTSARASAPERGWGLLRSRDAAQGQPKPAFCALRTLVSNPPPFAGCPRAAR